MSLIETQPPFLVDCANLPTYIVDTVFRRDIGGGTASIINCRTLHGVIIPLCEVIVTPEHLLAIGRGASDFALEMYHKRQMALMAEMIGKRH